MKLRLMLLVVTLIWSVTSSFAQTDEKFDLRIDVASAYIRSAPSLDAEVVASAFKDDIFETVGRNLDGSWLQVRRPGRMYDLGWMSHSVVRYDFNLERLPLTDLTTGLIGDTVLANDPGFAAFVEVTINLRRLPFEGENVIGQVPFGTVVPVLERNEDGNWVYIHYLGIEGWVDSLNLRGLPDPMLLPLAVGLPEIPTAQVTIIPLDVQLAEIAVFRDYVSRHAAFANELANFWAAVLNYERMPCQPPDFVITYLTSDLNERAFPEIEYLAPQAERGLPYIDAAIQPLYICGVTSPQIVRDAHAAAINASNILYGTLGTANRIEREILANH